MTFLLGRFYAPTLTTLLFLAGDCFGQTQFLSQNWTPEQRQEFYTTSQGSRMMPYDWFMALEAHDSSENFLKDVIPSLGYVPNPNPATNPDGLPVGFVKDTDTSGKTHIGLTCAACHTNQITFQGNTFQVDGAPTLADMWALLDGLDKALSATRDDPDKFDRFAAEVLGNDASSAQAALELREELVNFLDYWNRFIVDSRTPHGWGRARLDAFGMIFNRVSAIDLKIPANNRKPDAPVSYPFLWGTSFQDHVQWNGAAENSNDIERLGRNVGEVLGVFAQAEFTTRLGVPKARTSARRLNQVRLENLLKKLWSPQWPSELGTIDSEKSVAGSVLFQDNCVRCHEIIEHGKQDTPVKVSLTPISEVQTDPRMAVNAATGTVSTGKLRRAIGFRRRMPRGELLQRLVRLSILSPYRDVPQGDSLLSSIFDIERLDVRDQIFDPSEVKNFIDELDVDTREQAKQLMDKYSEKMARYYSDLKEADDWVKSGNLESLRSDEGESETSPDALRYKAGPLAGIWATAPYLHNGSVPNLYELVSPRKERTKVFYVGSTEFDPEKVGFDMSQGPGTTKFDTSLPGNSNAGHDMYGEFSEEERWQLVEYMKTL